MAFIAVKLYIDVTRPILEQCEVHRRDVFVGRRIRGWAYSLMHVGIVTHMPCMCVVKVVFTVYSRIRPKSVVVNF